MRMPTRILTLIILIHSLSGFGQHIEGYRQNENDLYFKFLQDEKGPTAKLGDVVSLHMVMKNDKGEELKNTYKEKGGKSMLFPVKFPTFPGDIYEAVTLMSAGDSANFLIPADSMYHRVFRKPLPANVQKGSLLVFVIKVEWIKTQDQIDIPDVTITVDRKELEKEEKEIEAYFAKFEMEYKKTESGVYIHISNDSQDKAVTKGKTITLNYTGMFLDGKTFETTEQPGGDHKPLTVIVGNQQVIRGWEDAFLTMKRGGTYTIAVPSHLAFGKNGRGQVIPPNTPLLFEIQILTVE